MFKWLNQLRGRAAKRRADRRATRGERAQKQNEAKALRLQHERMDGMGPNGPMGGPGI
jgi:hypothetical protein